MNWHILFFLLVLLTACTMCYCFLVGNTGHGSIKVGSNLSYGCVGTRREQQFVDLHTQGAESTCWCMFITVLKRKKRRGSWSSSCSYVWEAGFRSYENHYKLDEIRRFLAKGHQSIPILIHPHLTDWDYVYLTKEPVIWFERKHYSKIQGRQRYY